MFLGAKQLRTNRSESLVKMCVIRLDREVLTALQTLELIVLMDMMVKAIENDTQTRITITIPKNIIRYKWKINF